jgi:hypothetical protein
VTPDRWERIQSLFFATCELDPATRAVLLADACPDDPSVEREVEELVRADGRSGAAWEKSISNAVDAAAREFRGLPRHRKTG